MGIKCELYNDNFQNFKRYNIPIVTTAIIVAAPSPQRRGRK